MSNARVAVMLAAFGGSFTGGSIQYLWRDPYFTLGGLVIGSVFCTLACMLVGDHK